ncbi:MAG: hypothetical protein M5U26_11065 [Planctomycetota bacterium]|nr:hypothetical protein [Planctomycetota bacterium]
MAVRLKATCSECLTTHWSEMELGQEQIKCPACGHSLQSLPEGEFNEIELTIKKQRTNNIIALIAFGVAVIGFFCWVFKPELKYWSFPHAPQEDFWMTTGFPALTIVGLLVCLVFSVLGARHRFIIEF